MEELYAGKSKKIACYSPEQQKQYDALSEKQRAYVDYRSAGLEPKEAYISCGYNEKNASQKAYIIENRNNIKELINVRRSARLGNLPTEKQDDQVQVEYGKRVSFYENIINGKTRTVKKTTILNRDGSVRSTKIEEIDDVNARITARKELDKIVGLSRLPEIGSVIAGANITIKIVDAGNQEELQDSRNQVNNDWTAESEAESLERELEDEDVGEN